MALLYDLIDEILCFVPVKYIFRCRAVSKEWCSIIDSPAFRKKHLKNSIKCNPDGDGVFITGAQYCVTDLDSLYDANDATAICLDDTVKDVLSGAHFVGTANCLVCFCKNRMNEFLLLNPSTRKYKKIPRLPRKIGCFLDLMEASPCGFGYDHVNDDYKIFKVAQFQKLNPFKYLGIMVVVYSLKSNKWTEIQNVPSNFSLVTLLGMFKNGSLYWLANRYSVDFYHRTILGFDLGLEQFKEFRFPTANNGNFSVPTGGSFCIFDNCMNSRMDVWMVDNHEAENPWYKAFSVEQHGALGSFQYFRPVAFSKSGKDVLLEVDSTRLVWYDPERKVGKNVRIHGIPSKFGSQLYRESLLQLTENEHVQKSSENKKEKKQQKERESLLELTENEQLQKRSEDKKEEKQQKKRDDFLSKGFKLKL